MLRLVGAQERDTFYDLGCGWAQNLLVAATEFGVRKCVGIERDKRRHQKAVQRVGRWSVSDRVKIIRGDLENLIDGNLGEGNVGEATILFYGLATTPEFLELVSKRLRIGCRLVYYYNTLFPEIKADKTDYPFYVSISPFKRPVSELDWLSSIVQKTKLSLVSSTRPAARELWDELTHDYDFLGLRGEARRYRDRLRNVLKAMNG